MRKTPITKHGEINIKFSGGTTQIRVFTTAQGSVRYLAWDLAKFMTNERVNLTSLYCNGACRANSILKPARIDGQSRMVLTINEQDLRAFITKGLPQRRLPADVNARIFAIKDMTNRLLEKKPIITKKQSVKSAKSIKKIAAGINKLPVTPAPVKPMTMPLAHDPEVGVDLLIANNQQKQGFFSKILSIFR